MTGTDWPSALSAFDQGWLVGMWEGEGSFTCRRAMRSSANAYVRHLSIISTDRDVIERVHRIMQCGAIRTEPPAVEGRKIKYRYVVSKWADIEQWTRAMLPHLSERRAQQARNMLAHPPASRFRDRCKRGHARTAENLRYDRNGSRHCRACDRVRRDDRREQRIKDLGQLSLVVFDRRSRSPSDVVVLVPGLIGRRDVASECP